MIDLKIIVIEVLLLLLIREKDYGTKVNVIFSTSLAILNVILICSP